MTPTPSAPGTPLVKLPKTFAALPEAPRLEAYFSRDAAPLREGGEVLVSRVPFDAPLTRALGVAHLAGHLAQGLEQIEKALDRELKGLVALQQKTGQAPGTRMSRLLILANDGSDRFYRAAESLLKRHAGRTWGVLVAATAEELGARLTAKAGAARALLIDDRAALESALMVLADDLAKARF